MEECDIAILGAGVIGSSVAYILSSFSGLNIVVLEKELEPAVHSSSRNTGVIHRPFYLDPSRKNIFALSSQISYPMWKELAINKKLPWKQNGTIEVALENDDLKTLEKYLIYSEKNGMEEHEYAILDRKEINDIEKGIKSEYAFFSKTDTNVSFGEFTRTIFELAIECGIKAFFGVTVTQIDDKEGILLFNDNKGKKRKLSAKIILNVSGGGALMQAKKCGLAKRYSILHFRGDYWKLGLKEMYDIKHNIYSVPRHLKYPFLDPHFIIRPNGEKEIGPNAHLVNSPYAYPKGDSNKRSGESDLFSLPLMPKIRLFANHEFISLALNEWKSSTYRGEMIKRVKDFIPEIDERMITGKGLSGIRHSLIDNNGFVPEAIIEKGEKSLHVLNFNSPGATGSPAYAIHIYSEIRKMGLLPEEKSTLNLSNNHIWSEGVKKANEVFG